MVTSAKVIADSISPSGSRLTTLEVVMHRFVLAEFNTHRMFSRNSASSRAIPVSKQIDRVLNDSALPVVWATEQKGMQGGDEADEITQKVAKEVWRVARENAVFSAQVLVNLGIHKSITNRLLEPFMWHTVIVSSTEWENFWRQRCSPLAQPEMKAAADAMFAAFKDSTPAPLRPGEYHMPYIFDNDWTECKQATDLPMISVARCARVSYLTHDGKRSLDADLDMYEKLISANPPHASPLEHVATPCPEYEASEGNFHHWRQMRHDVLGF